jgi:hypothetical protein
MSDDLFGGGFAWGEDDLSQTGATPTATPKTSPTNAEKVGKSHLSPAPVASVATVADRKSDALIARLSQPIVAKVATPPATPEMAEVSGIEPNPATAVADVATVALWRDGVGALCAMDARGEIHGLQRDAVKLLRDWGDDLVGLGWSTLDVWGGNRHFHERRVDRQGLIFAVRGGDVVAVDSGTATIAWGRDHVTYYRKWRAAGGVPVWLVDVGAGRTGAGGSALTRLPPDATLCQRPSGGSELEDTRWG